MIPLSLPPSATTARPYSTAPGATGAKKEEGYGAGAPLGPRVSIE